MLAQCGTKPRRLIIISVLLANCALLACGIYNGAPTTYKLSGGFIVQLYRKECFTGAGSLIHERFVLTAAHCVDKGISEEYIVMHGATHLKHTECDPFEKKKRVEVVTMELHSAFDRVQSENDIAVLLLAEALRGPSVKPIPLATRPYQLGKELALVLGWGDTNVPLAVCASLYDMYVPILNWTRCRDQIRPEHGELHAGMLCTFGGDTSGICNGDSGGPVTVNGELAGVINWYANPGCGNGVMPDIHADVYYYRDFIATAMKKLSSRRIITTC